ncbi:MAG: TIGR04282 family arsenosugar biosynthesis glycosyltransferase [Planctomycetota bacterium]
MPEEDRSQGAVHEPAVAAEALVLVFAKVPRPGGCKSRLAATIGDEAAAQLAAAFLADTLTAARASRGAVVLYGNHADAHAFPPQLRAGVTYEHQGDGDLGARLARGFRWGFARGARAVLAIGADTPQITPALIDTAIAAACAGSAVLGPATDGGYYLLALPAGFPLSGPIFSDPDWGGSEVLATTRAALAAAPCPWRLLEPLTDIDRESDLAVLRVPATNATLSHTAPVLARLGAPGNAAEGMDGTGSPPVP